MQRSGRGGQFCGKVSTVGLPIVMEPEFRRFSSKINECFSMQVKAGFSTVENCLQSVD